MAFQDQPPSPAYAEEKLFIEAVGHRIPAALTLPAGSEPRGAVVIVPGSLYIDVDGNMPMFNARPHAYADLARQLASRGYAALRYAKRGPGTGSEVVDSAAAAANRTFQSRVVVLEAALEALRGRLSAGIRVVAAGHSEGAVVASMAAAQGVPMDGVVILSGPSVGIFGIMREQLPVPPGSPPEAYAAFDRVVAAYHAGDPAPPLDPTDPTLRSLAFVQRQGEAGVRYMVEIDSVDPAATLARVTQPVLLVQGGRDGSVPPHHARALRSARDAAGLPTGSRYFAELTHFYKVAPEGMDPMAAFMLETESDPAVADAVVDWMESERARTPSGPGRREGHAGRAGHSPISGSPFPNRSGTCP